MPVVTLFGPPEPEDKKVVGTADVINYFPKINLQGKLLWEQRPGLTPIALLDPPTLRLSQLRLEVLAFPEIFLVLTQQRLEVLAAPPEETFVCNGIECTGYPTDYGNIVDVWEIDNITKTFHCPVILPEAVDEGGIKSGLLSAGEALPFSGQKRTITLIYRTVDNPSFFTEVIGPDETPANLSFSNSATSKRVHFNISEIQNFYVLFWSWTGAITGSFPDLVAEFSGEIYIDCIQIDARDWASFDESLLIVYDD